MDDSKFILAIMGHYGPILAKVGDHGLMANVIDSTNMAKMGDLRPILANLDDSRKIIANLAHYGAILANVHYHSPVLTPDEDGPILIPWANIGPYG